MGKRAWWSDKAKVDNEKIVYVKKKKFRPWMSEKFKIFVAPENCES